MRPHTISILAFSGALLACTPTALADTLSPPFTYDVTLTSLGSFNGPSYTAPTVVGTGTLITSFGGFSYFSGESSGTFTADLTVDGINFTGTNVGTAYQYNNDPGQFFDFNLGVSQNFGVGLHENPDGTFSPGPATEVTLMITNNIGSMGTFNLGEINFSPTGVVTFAGDFGTSLIVPEQTTVTPEPSSLALLGTGLLGVLGAARRRMLNG